LQVCFAACDPAIGVLAWGALGQFLTIAVSRLAAESSCCFTLSFRDHPGTVPAPFQKPGFVSAAEAGMHTASTFY